jgi:polysaccharide pyruvyl transferase WcaK-like protein
MHATIGALSSGVPAAAIGYSMKTRAVFETCGVAGEVTDVSGLGDGDIVEQLWDSFTRRDAVRATLGTTIPAVRRAAGAQMDDIAALIISEHRALATA